MGQQKNTLQNFQKMYYSIGEVAEMFNVNTSLIRFWETEFDCIKPYKNKKGTRYFTQEDITVFGKIFYLVKQKGYTLQGAKQLLSLNKEQVDRNALVVEKLMGIRKFLLEIKEKLDA